MSISNPEFSNSTLLKPVELHDDHNDHKKGLGAMMIAAIGVVFGDIGTSPLYALKECFDPEHGITFSPEALFGVIAMMIWSLIMVVTFKYVLFVMRADNKGEGGVLSLMALALRTFDSKSKKYFFLMILGMLGACMLLGESVITPAISVLSAVEGIEIAAPGLHKYIIPISLVILVALFLIQKYGTAAVGNLFGPVTLTWFITLAVLGAINIGAAPQIIGAINPIYAVHFIVDHPTTAYIVMGAVVLVVTGVEALYLDMGHFGRSPVRYAWLIVVLPSLLINYLGQGALLLSNPEAVSNPFYLMVPEWALWPVVGLATAATVIASQAVISGAYSLVSQAILLGFMPRMTIMHTSDSEQGQIYIPVVNWVLLFMVVVTIIEFRESVNLAAAYGISVTSTMMITAILLGVVMYREWKMNIFLVLGLSIIFFILDFAFWTANLIKIKDGGWYPLFLGLVIFTCLITWYRGRKLLRAKVEEGSIPLQAFVSSLLAHPPHRVEGTAIFLTAHVDYVPVAMLHNLKHNRVMHERIFFIKLSTWDVPYVNDDQRITMKDLGGGVYLVRAVHGFKESPDINKVLELLQKQENIEFNVMDTSFFVSRDTIVPSANPGMALWREKLFGWMMQNAAKPSDFFKIPANRLVELGAKVEI
ncbi:potassium transporter Kup [Polynucleobacter sp. AP-Jannik-300A-C4]|jgi:KUP system potassium uptake protein|uniref:potassium transporter Kup n=1 Tax=Polynucleobacter sp. AP-Jannik-300A-C4 TaxID=2576928 RepID=UPI001BFEBA86|nr:potassium transporter Kup [Polynucleobacter sp. AP-Jannik-300A-C4]